MSGWVGWVGCPVGAPVPAFQSPITGMYRDALNGDNGAHLTALETAATVPRVLHRTPHQDSVDPHGQNQFGAMGTRELWLHLNAFISFISSNDLDQSCTCLTS